jgi:selenocysteine-specific elongation factor
VSAAAPRGVVIGTAGHVDHGKSALVQALTGTDPDRWAEEKARGLTIDLGFAWRQLPGGGHASFVDVPGHEDFIRNMLAGAGGVDAVLLVVAADEGPMPQTREHLAIMHLLGIHRGVVALTKTDLVDEEWLALVQAEVEDLLAGTALAQAPLLPVSIVSGAGLDALLEALARVLAALPAAPDHGRARLAVDRAFSLAGFGTVVTGTLRDGELPPAGVLEILPAGIRARVRGLQSHGRSVRQALPGTRTAVNLAGVSTEQVTRGDVVCLPGAYRPSRLLDAVVSILADCPHALRHDAEVHLYHGAAEIPARVRVIGGRELAPGRTDQPVQLRLARPTVLAAGDRFILRQPSPAATIGGGRVLDPHPPGRQRRFREATLGRFQALASGGPEAVIWTLLAGREPCRAEALTSADTGLDPAVRDATLARLAEAGRVRRLGELWMTDQGWASLSARLRAALEEHHARHPLRAGMPSEELRARAGLAGDVFPAVVAAARADGWLAGGAEALYLVEHRVQFEPQAQAAIEALLARYRAAPFSPPSPQEAEGLVGPDVLAALIERGDLVAVSKDVLFDRQGYEDLRRGVLGVLTERGTITVGELRDEFHTSRKFALAFLEHLDRLRLTRRQGDLRVMAGGGRR